MIKILKEGTKQKVKCDCCGALLKFDGHDMRYNNYACLVNHKGYIHCPQCGHKIFV